MWSELNSNGENNENMNEIIQDIELKQSILIKEFQQSV
jgi:hypothetical protein